MKSDYQYLFSETGTSENLPPLAPVLSLASLDLNSPFFNIYSQRPLEYMLKKDISSSF